MQLIFLYGPPGVGKLTVARELSTLTGFRLFHNHLTVNLVTAIFQPRTDAWDRLAARIRLDVFSEAAREGVDLILTRAPRLVDDAELARVEAMVAPIRASNGSALFVRLACDRAELLRRVRSSDRQAHDKLTDPDVLLDQVDLDATLPFQPHLWLDTTALTPTQAADRIATHFDLPRLGAR
jgi:hypothetical protein